MITLKLTTHSFLLFLFLLLLLTLLHLFRLFSQLMLRLSFQLLLQLLLRLLILDRVYDQSHWPVPHDLHIHVLPERPRIHSILSILLSKILKKAIKQWMCVFALHGIMKIRFSSFELMIECELRDE